MKYLLQRDHTGKLCCDYDSYNALINVLAEDTERFDLTKFFFSLQHACYKAKEMGQDVTKLLALYKALEYQAINRARYHLLKTKFIQNNRYGKYGDESVKDTNSLPTNLLCEVAKYL